MLENEREKPFIFCVKGRPRRFCFLLRVSLVQIQASYGAKGVQGFFPGGARDILASLPFSHRGVLNLH